MARVVEDRNQRRVFFSLMVGRFPDELLIFFIEGARRYAAMGKFASRNIVEEMMEEERQQVAWEEAAICRLEMKRRQELDSDDCLKCEEAERVL